jgi:cellulose synthase/poly-beta-1,6-N-acetylglucosamine synthase-like glycosyltransferase
MTPVFWVAVALVGYTYLVYPAAVFLASRLRPAATAGEPTCRPTISIVISLYNEEGHVANKIDNLRGLDYPRERVQILIGSDGSTDRTNAILGQLVGDPAVAVVCQDHRAGKPAMLNTLAPLATGDLLVFTDARQRLDAGALRELAKHFRDPGIGSVSGELLFEDVSGKPVGVGLYWEYEKFIRRSESRLRSMLGATGALYAIRRELFTPVPPGLVLDDVFIPLKVVEQGYRAIFEPAARIYDRIAGNARAEFARKSRTLAGNFQLLRHFPWAVNPFNGLVAWQFFSHKVLRLFVPYCLLALLGANLFLLGSAFYRATLAAQAAFYLCALAGAFTSRPIRVFDVPHMFCVMNWAAVVGLYRFLAGSQDVVWQKAEGR